MAHSQNIRSTLSAHRAESIAPPAHLPGTSAAILTGGAARRMGGAFKPGLRIGDRSILERQVSVLRQCGVTNILLVGRHPASGTPEEARRLGLYCVADAVEGGALAGLYSALLAATAPVVVVLAGDMPFVSPALIQRLTALAGARPDAGANSAASPGMDADADAIVPRIHGRWHPLCAAYRRRVALRLKARLDRGALRVTDALSDMHVRALPDAELAALGGPKVLMNVNTPDDFRAAGGEKIYGA